MNSLLFVSEIIFSFCDKITFSFSLLFFGISIFLIFCSANLFLLLVIWGFSFGNNCFLTKALFILIFGFFLGNITLIFFSFLTVSILGLDLGSSFKLVSDRAGKYYKLNNKKTRLIKCLSIKLREFSLILYK